MWRGEDKIFFRTNQRYIFRVFRNCVLVWPLRGLPNFSFRHNVKIYQNINQNLFIISVSTDVVYLITMNFLSLIKKCRTLTTRCNQFYFGWKMSVVVDPVASSASKYDNVGGVRLTNRTLIVHENGPKVTFIHIQYIIHIRTMISDCKASFSSHLLSENGCNRHNWLWHKGVFCS